MPKEKKYKKGLKIKKNFLIFLLVVFKVFFVLGRVLLSFGLLVKKLIKPFLRLFFYKVIVRVYCGYNSFLKNLGWDRRKRQNVLAFLFNEKTVHVLVALLTLVIVTVNLTQYTSAKNTMEVKKQALITELVQTEFGDQNNQELIEESLGEDSARPFVQKQSRYVDYGIALKKEVEEENSNLFLPSQSETEGLNQEKDSSENIARKRKEVVEYKVKSGDTVSTIAAQFGVSVNTILWENDLSSYSLIRPGDTLAILPVSGIRHEVESGESLSYIARQYDIDTNKIAKANNLGDVSRLSIGEELIIPGGEKITTSRSSNQSSQSSSYSAISAVKKIVKPKTKTTSNKMFWPTEGHKITQYYSWRHHGLDIANKTGTPLYCSDAGTVESVGWSRGYGNNIIVNHGGGKKTRYAHLSRFYVSRGQRVDKGQSIGEMGNTGWSTGPHLHFEVIINGVRYNPLNYIK